MGSQKMEMEDLLPDGRTWNAVTFEEAILKAIIRCKIADYQYEADEFRAHHYAPANKSLWAVFEDLLQRRYKVLLAQHFRTRKKKKKKKA